MRQVSPRPSPVGDKSTSLERKIASGGKVREKEAMKDAEFNNHRKQRGRGVASRPETWM